jgi:hypothetical protein
MPAENIMTMPDHGRVQLNVFADYVDSADDFKHSIYWLRSAELRGATLELLIEVLEEHAAALP